MSIRSMSNRAVERDKAAPGKSAKGGAAGAEGAEVSQQFVDALTSAIPTEPLSAYTAAIGVVAGLKAGNYLPHRWGAFGVFVIVTALSVIISYETKYKSPARPLAQENKRSFPLDRAQRAVSRGPPGLPLLRIACASI